jgi:hypothetical protein
MRLKRLSAETAGVLLSFCAASPVRAHPPTPPGDACSLHPTRNAPGVGSIPICGNSAPRLEENWHAPRAARVSHDGDASCHFDLPGNNELGSDFASPRDFDGSQ